jgi:hypothetical protein
VNTLGDEADQANRIADAERESMIARARAAASASPIKPTGLCRECDEPVVTPKLFCDSSCSAAWSRRARRR